MVGQKKHSKNKNHNNKINNTQSNANAKVSPTPNSSNNNIKSQSESQATSSSVSNAMPASVSGGVETINHLDKSLQKLNVNNKKAVISPQKRNELMGHVKALQKLGFSKADTLKEKWDQYKKIQEILKKVMAIEEPLNPFKGKDSSAKRMEKISNLYKWAKENDIKYDGIEISEFPGYGLGLKATRDIKKDEEIFSLDHSLTLREKKLENGFNMGNMSNINLAYAVMQEFLDPESIFRPYLDLLPTEYNTCLYYTESDMEMLKGCSVLPTVLNLCKVIARQYAIFYDSIHSLPMPRNADQKAILLKERFCYALCRWAVSTVMTRQNFLPDLSKDSNDVNLISVLIPFWDMANHQKGEISSFFNAVDSKVVSSAQNDYKAGEQIFIHYGKRTNAELLVHNAFIQPENPDDYVGIKLGLSPSDPLLNQRKELLDLLKIPVNNDLKILPSPDCISPELLAYVRVFNMNASQLEHWIQSGRPLDLMHMDCALDTDLENKTWTYIQNRLMILLRCYPTTLEEDEQQLEKYKNNELTLSDIEALLLSYRIIEKRIFSEAFAYAKQKTKA